MDTIYPYLKVLGIHKKVRKERRSEKVTTSRIKGFNSHLDPKSHSQSFSYLI